MRSWLVQSELKPILDTFDIVNFHSMDRQSVFLSTFLSSGTKCVYSFWGSDLYTTNQELIEIQRTQITKVDGISLHSAEMQEQLIKLFPNVNSEIVYKQLFGIPEILFSTFEDLRQNLNLNEFKKTHGIPLDKVIVTVGYADRPVCNHFEILDHLKTLSPDLLAQIHLIIPMSYGFNRLYITKLTNYLDQLTQVSITKITEYLPYKDLLSLRMSSDVFIHGNLTDAFSRSMLEYICANNICIIGDWLPYSRLTDAEVLYQSFSKTNDIGGLLENTLVNLEQLKLDYKGNYDLIKSNFGIDTVAQYWVNMYNEILNNNT